MQLLTYLNNRKLGNHPTQTPLIDGINDIKERLQQACQSLDRRIALVKFCHDYAYQYIENEQGYGLLDIMPVTETSYNSNWVEIGYAGYPDYMSDHMAAVYINVANGQILDTFLDDTTSDITTYLELRKAWWKRKLGNHTSIQ